MARADITPSGLVLSDSRPGLSCTARHSWNHPAELRVDGGVKIDVTEKAAAVIRKRGGVAVVDLLEPYG